MKTPTPLSIEDILIRMIQTMGRAHTAEYVQKRIAFWKKLGMDFMAEKWEKLYEKYDLGLCDAAYKEANRN